MWREAAGRVLTSPFPSSAVFDFLVFAIGFFVVVGSCEMRAVTWRVSYHLSQVVSKRVGVG